MSKEAGVPLDQKVGQQATRSVLGRYRLGDIIGAGGMGTVVRAHDEVLGREVAVKLLREELAADERSLARFRQEARIAASLSHPGIAAVYDFAEEEGRPAIVMELLDGQDLHTILATGGPMAGAEVAGILAQAADALAYAHGLGAVHRDIKPANIFLTRSGAVKITDFGVAFAAGGGQLTTTGALIGTPDYLSPEQVRGERATSASDIYSLGCVAFQLVTGHPPFAGDNSIASATARLDAPAPSAGALNPAVGAEMDAVIRRALAPTADERFPSAAAMARALRSAARPPSGTAPMPAAAAGPGTVPLMVGPPTMVEAAPGAVPRPPTPPQAPHPPARVPRRRGRLAWVLAALVVLFMAGLSFDIVRSWQRMNAPKALPAWTGMTFDQASAAARGMGFTVARTNVPSDQPAGQVLVQDPKAGAKLKRGLGVTFSVSLGNLAAVPDVTTKNVTDATTIIKAKGFLHVVVSDQTVPGTVDGQVYAQSPLPGAVVAKDAPVTLTVTAVPEQDQNSGDNSSNPGSGLLCSLIGYGCSTPSPSPTPTAKHRHGGGGG